MALLESVLHGSVAHTHQRVGEAVYMRVSVGQSPPLFESAVAYVSEEEEPNRLLVLARACDVPDGYGDYELAPSELERVDDGLDEFQIAWPDGHPSDSD